MMLKLRGTCSFSEREVDEVYDSDDQAGTKCCCRIGEHSLVGAIEDAEVEGIVTVAFPGFRFHGEIAYSASSQDPKTLKETLTVNGEDLLAPLRQHEGKIIWFWLADKPLSALQLTELGFQYVEDIDDDMLHLGDGNLPEVALKAWENAYQCASEALLIEHNDAQLIGLFALSVVTTGRLADYGPVVLILMLSRAIELVPEDTNLLYFRANLLDLVGETERGAADRTRIKEIRQRRMQSYAEHTQKAMRNQRRTTSEPITSGDSGEGY